MITPTAVEPDDSRSYYSVANQIVAETPNAILANQYHNPENPRSPYLTTGPEIWEQTQGQVTDFIAGVGTGGTISDTGRYLKEQNPDVRIIGVDPKGSILLETWEQGRVPDDAEAKPYKIEGIGEDFLPSTLDLSIIDEIVRVTDKEAFQWTRRIVKEEGIKWMRENGLLESEWESVRLGEILAQKHLPRLVTASISDRMRDVIARSTS